VMRWLGSQAIEGLDEIPRYLFVWLVAIGGAAAMHRGEHTVLDYFVNRLGPTGRAIMAILQNAVMIAVFAFLIDLSLTLVPNAALQSSPSLGLRLDYVFAAVPVGAALILPPMVRNVLRSLGQLGPAPRIAVLLVLAVICAWFLLVPGSTESLRQTLMPVIATTNMAVVLLVVFVLAIIGGVPIGMALCVGAFGTALLYPAVKPIIVPTKFVGIISDSYLLLSAPLFILAGNIAARGGVARVLIDLATVLVGRFRGGLAYVNVCDSMFFGGISGSAVADVSALGTFLIPQMERKGYDREFATALTVSTAVVAPIIPPSIIAVIFAWMADESVAAMFAAGIIPGLLVGLGMAVPVYVISKKRNYPKEPPPTARQFFAALLRATPALMIPAIIMGGLLIGWFTPTEAAGVAVIYALAIPPIFYREPALRDLPAIFIDSARLSGVIGMIIGFVGAFGWILTFSKFPFLVASAITALGPTWWMFMCLIIVLYLVLGTFLTPSEIILVTVPVLLPVSQAIGIHPIHFGIVCVIASAVGHITPPVGLCLFVGMAISGLSMDRLMKPLLPFLGAIVITLLMVAFIPELSLFLPKLLGLAK
ncbi:MAG TPA: TRAP transporter large permease subunit, partial [Hyphomicrobiaceae bacterium]|nr:TRAP transporter large permease subunit [Hyphomicrobiaceae bacterium]